MFFNIILTNNGLFCQFTKNEFMQIINKSIQPET